MNFAEMLGKIVQKNFVSSKIFSPKLQDFFLNSIIRNIHLLAMKNIC